jgi:predicted transposase/invertase (TIGR01784 family)
MQVEDNKDFAKRACYYSAKAYSQQLKKTQRYSKLRPVIFLGILNFNCFDGPDFLTRHLILNQKTLKQEIEELEFSFIELPKFTKTEAKLVDVIDKWTYFIKHAGRLKKAPKTLLKVPEISEAFEVADQHLWTAEELDNYESWLDRENRRRGSIEVAVEAAAAAAAEAARQAAEAAEAVAAAEAEVKKEKAARQKAEADKQKAEADKQKAEADKQKAEADKQKAEADKQKAEALARREKFIAAEHLRELNLSDAQIQKVSGISLAQLKAWIRSGRA